MLVKKQDIKTKSFLNPVDLLSQVGLEEGMSVADFGCGNGYFSVAAAKMVGSNGQVNALDILEHMLSQTASQAKLEEVYNVTTIHCDLDNESCKQIDDQSIDFVIVSSLLHQVVKKGNILREAYRVLKTGGQIMVVEWQATSSFGPPRGERVSESDIRAKLQEFGFKPSSELSAGSFHYALLYRK